MEEQNTHKNSTRIKIVSMGDAEVGKVLKFDIFIHSIDIFMFNVIVVVVNIKYFNVFRAVLSNDIVKRDLSTST